MADEGEIGKQKLKKLCMKVKVGLNLLFQCLRGHDRHDRDDNSFFDTFHAQDYLGRLQEI